MYMVYKLYMFYGIYYILPISRNYSFYTHKTTIKSRANSFNDYYTVNIHKLCIGTYSLYYFVYFVSL